jgi:hypothetical protein
MGEILTRMEGPLSRKTQLVVDRGQPFTAWVQPVHPNDRKRLSQSLRWALDCAVFHDTGEDNRMPGVIARTK